MTVRRYTKVYKLIGDGVTERVFPNSGRRYEKFRTVSHVVLQRHAALAAAQGDDTPPKLVVSNLFVCNGKHHHKVPGRNPEKRVAFKVRVVAKGILRQCTGADTYITLHGAAITEHAQPVARGA